MGDKISCIYNVTILWDVGIYDKAKNQGGTRMKRNLFKRVVVTALALAMVVSTFAGCGSKTEEASGTIMWLSNTSSGPGFDAPLAYLTAICDEVGYDVVVVYGDAANDPNGNLQSVKNGMTDDVVGIIMSQDGGISDIMAEYPEIFVVGYNCDIRSIFDADGADASLLENDKFLGIMMDGYSDGALEGKAEAQNVIDAGYKKVATIIFPGFAYPKHPEADAAFRAAIAEYNETAEEPIEVVDEKALTLMFAPLEESYFLEAGHSDLDAIVGFCAGTQFIYPTMKTAMANGTCSPDTKLLTRGLEDSADMLADVGPDKVITEIKIAPMEDIGYAAILIYRAATDTLYSDFEIERVDSLPYLITNQEEVDKVMNNSLAGTADASKAQITVAELLAVESFADLKALFQSDQLKVSGIK